MIKKYKKNGNTKWQTNYIREDLIPRRYLLVTMVRIISGYQIWRSQGEDNVALVANEMAVGQVVGDGVMIPVK